MLVDKNPNDKKLTTLGNLLFKIVFTLEIQGKIRIILQGKSFKLFLVFYICHFNALQIIISM